MADPRTNWSLGTFGAIAEFARDADEPMTLSRSAVALAAMTGRGGIRIEPGNGVRLFASESTTRDSWNHRIALCLPERQCAMNQRTALTELGPDREALREQYREATLFDLGLGALQVDVCVRVADADVAAELRTHAATEPVPEGWIPCAHLYPAHPAKDAFGRPHPFEPAHHHAFQKMLQDFGDPKFYALKQQVLAAVAAGEDPSVIAIAGDRFARTSIRVALRQLKAADGMSPSLMMWLSAHERPDQIEMEEQGPGYDEGVYS